MCNLLKETREVLKKRGYDWKDIKAIVAPASDLRISVDHFRKLADVVYDADYGAQKVAYDLCIVMNDGAWFTRGEYDGSEWWMYHRYPSIPEHTDDNRVNRLVVSDRQVGWCTLAECNELKKED